MAYGISDGKRRVLLTGGSGTLGFNLARLLASDSRFEAVLPVRRSHPCLRALGERIEMIPFEFGARSDMDALLARAQPDVIVHCATSGLRPPKPSWSEMQGFNVSATQMLFESYCGSRASHFVQVSTGMVYRGMNRPIRETDPVDTLQPYAAGKAAADLLLQAAAMQAGRRLTVLRPFGFTGANDFRPRLFPSLVHAAATGEPLPMTHGDQVRDYCAAGDIAEAIRRCITRDSDNAVEIFNLGCGTPRSVRAWVETVRAELGISVQIRFGQVPYPPHDPMYLVADAEAARQKLEWQATIRLSYAVWELAQEMAPRLSMHKPERFQCPTVVNFR